MLTESTTPCRYRTPWREIVGSTSPRLGMSPPAAVSSSVSVVVFTFTKKGGVVGTPCRAGRAIKLQPLPIHPPRRFRADQVAGGRRDLESQRGKGY